MARFQETVDIQPQSTRSFSEQTIQSIVQRVENFNLMQQQLRSGIIAELQQKAEARGRASADAMTLNVNDKNIVQAPEYKKERFIGGIEIKAHNQALRDAYVAALKNDIEQNIAEIQARHPDDIMMFNEAATSFAYGIMNGVDPGVKNLIAAELDKYITAGRINVQAANIQKDNRLVIQDLETQANAFADNAVKYSRFGDIGLSLSNRFNFVKIVKERIKLGHITEFEGEKEIHDNEVEFRNALFIKKVREFTDIDEFEKAIGFIDEIRQRYPDGYNLKEGDALINTMLADVQQSLSMKDKEDVAADELEKKRVEEQTRIISEDIAFGNIYSVEDLTRRLKKAKLPPPEFNAIMNQWQNRGAGLDDLMTIDSIKIDIENLIQGRGIDPGLIRKEIISESGRNITQKTASYLKTLLNEAVNKESMLYTNNVNRAREFLKNSIQLAPEDARFIQDTSYLRIRDFDERVLSGEDPWKIADELSIKDNWERTPAPAIGMNPLPKDDFEGNLKKLDEAFDNGVIDDMTYDYQKKLVLKLRAIKEHMKTFQDTYKKENAKQQ